MVEYIFEAPRSLRVACACVMARLAYTFICVVAWVLLQSSEHVALLHRGVHITLRVPLGLLVRLCVLLRLYLLLLHDRTDLVPLHLLSCLRRPL